MSWLSRLLPNCQEMAQLLSDSMDRTLPVHLRIRMYLHLRMCVLCEGYKRHLGLIRDLLRKDGAQLIEVDRPQKRGLSPEAKARIQRAIDSSHK